MEEYFSDVWKRVPGAKCFIIANWSGNKGVNAESMATGLAESEKALLEKMKKIEEVVNAKCSSSYRGSETERRQKEALFSCIGNEKMRQHFWQTATKNAGRPLTLLCRCLVESLTTLFNDVSSTLEFLEMYQTVSIGKELGDFADNFVDCRKDFFLEPTIGRQEDGISYEDVVKKITCNAMEEYKALLASGVKLPDLAPPKFCPKVCLIDGFGLEFWSLWFLILSLRRTRMPGWRYSNPMRS